MSFPKCFYLLAFGQVSRNLAEAQQIASFIKQGCDCDVGPEPRSTLNLSNKSMMKKQVLSFQSVTALAMDQLLGRDTARVFNDVSVDIASGNTTPEKATKAIEASWQQNKM